MVTVGLVHARVRPEERLLLEAGERLGIHVVPQHDEHLVLDLDGGGLEGDVILSRNISTTRGLYVLRTCEALGIPAVNRFDVAARCADKWATSLALHRAGVPTPPSRIAFSAATGLEATTATGYPAVIKPVQGSWARGVARVRDDAEAEQLLELRAMLPSPVQHVVYVQPYVEKVQGDQHVDLRAFVVGERTIACIERRSPHWITNTARGATTAVRPVDDDLDDLCVRAAAAVGGGVLAIDLMQTPEGLTVHEVNHTMEFRNSIAPTGVDIPGEILRHCVEEARQ